MPFLLFFSQTTVALMWHSVAYVLCIVDHMQILAYMNK